MSDSTLYLIASGPHPSTVANKVVRLTERSRTDAESIASDRGVVASGLSVEEVEPLLETLRSAGAVVMALPEAVCDVPDGLPLRLHVVDAEGEPVKGTDVSVRTPNDAFNDAVPTVTTDDTGLAVVKDFTTLIDEHFDEQTGLPPVWFEVRRKDESFELTGSEFTDWEAFRDGEVRTYEVQVHRKSEDSEKQPEAKEPSETIEGEYVVEGRLELESCEPAAEYTVVAYDRDLVGAQRLGESTTGDDGGYRISYDASAFRQDEAGTADLRLRAFTASGRELSVDVTQPDVPTVRGEQILFDAGPEETVHLRLTEPVSEKTTERSRYERARDRITDATGEVSLHTLSDDDQIFLHHDTNVALRDVAFVVEDARLRRITDMPEGVFFGLGVEGIGVVSEDGDGSPEIDLSLLREHTADTLMEHVETTLDNHIIPAAIGEQLDEVRAQLESLKTKSPSESPATRRRHAQKVSSLAGVNDDTSQTLSRRVPETEPTEETWNRLVEEGVLSNEHVSSVKRAFEVDTITQNYLPLTQAVLEGGMPQIDGSIDSTRELARFDATDWKKVLQENNIPPPEGYDADIYAEAVMAQVEARYPTTFLAHRTTRRDRPDLSERLHRVQSNASIRENLFTELAGSGPADIGDLRADTDLDLVDEIRELTAFARTFRSLEVPEVLDDPDLSVDEKIEEVDRRIQAVDTVFENNVGTDLLCVDALNLPQHIPSIDHTEETVPSGDGAPAEGDTSRENEPDADGEFEISAGPTLSYDGVADDLKPMVRRQMQTYQRTLALTGRAEEAVSLLREGYDSARSVASTNRSVFSEQANLSPDRAESVYDKAVFNAERARYKVGKVLGEALRHRTPLPSDNTDDRVVNTLKELDGFEKILGNRIGCDCEHCRSIFGPLAYFVDLMRFVEQNVIKKHFRSVDDHPLDPRTRRPDLWDGVSLTCDNATEMVPYLQIVVEVLTAFIARDEGINTSGLDRAGVVKKVFDALREGDRSFDQPFNLPYDEMLRGLDRLDLDPASVAGAAGAGVTVTARMRLGLSPEDVKTITTPIASDTAELRRRYGIPSGEALDTLDVRGLKQATGLDRDAIGRLVELNFVDGPSTSGRGIHIKTVMGDAGLQPKAQELKGLTAERLDRLFRLVRLHRTLPWPLEAVNHAIYATTRASGASDAIIDERTIRDIAAIRRLQTELDASVAQVFALVDRIPTAPIKPDADSHFDQLFNPEASVEENGEFDPSTSVDFWHPPYDDGAGSGEARDPNLPRLLKAIGVSEKTFNALMETLKDRLTINTRTSSGGETRHYVELTLDSLSTLYRHAFLLNQLDLSVSELDAALQMVQSDLPKPSGSGRDKWALGEWPHESNVDASGTQPPSKSDFAPVAQSLHDLLSWIRESDLSIPDAASIALDSPPERDDPIRMFTASAASDLASEVKSRVTFTNQDVYEQVDLSETVVDSVLKALGDAGYLSRPSQNDPWRLTASYDPSTFPGGLNLDADVDFELTDAKKEAVRRALNRYLPETHAAEVLAKTLDVTSERLRKLLRVATGVTPDPKKVLTRKQGLRLSTPPTPANNRSTSDLLTILEPLEDIYLAADRLGLSDAALDVVVTDPSVFELSPGDRQLVTRESLRRLAQYRGLREETSAPEALDALFQDDSLDSDYGSLPSDKQDALSGQLAVVADTDRDAADSALNSIPTRTPRPDRTADLVEAIDLARTLETTGSGLALFRATAYDRVKQARDVVYSALYARYEKEERKSALEPLREGIRERQRDVLVSHLTAQPALQLDTPKDIYYYFLLDPEMSGCARTSRVVAATGSLQLYVHRCLMNLEQEAKGKAEVEDNRIHVKPSDIPDKEWDWRKKYRVWEANRKVFLYPENYLEPGLRDDATEPFETLEDRLLQEDVDDSTARKLYREYLDSFEEVANLRIAGHYFEPASDSSNGLPDYHDRAGTLYLVGRTPSNPRQFYLRTRTLTLPEDDSVEDYTETWSNWSRIEMDIQADQVSPVIFRNRLYLFWVESTTKPWHSGSGEDRNFVGYRHAIKLKFIRQTAKGQWTSPQEIELPTSLRTVDDPLALFRPVYYANYKENGHLGEAKDWKTPQFQRAKEPEHEEPRDDYTLDHRLYNRIFPFVQDDTLYFKYGVDAVGADTTYVVDLIEHAASHVDEEPARTSRPTPTLRMQVPASYYRRPEDRTDTPVALYFGQDREWEPYASHYYLSEKKRYEELQLVYHESGEYFTLSVADGAHMAKTGEVPRSARIQSVNNAPHLFVMEQSEGALLIEHTENWEMETRHLRTSTAETLHEILFEEGLREMLGVETQQQLREPELIERASPIGIIATGSETVSLPRPKPSPRSKTKASPHSFLTYLWEVFFHAPLLIAHTLNGRDRFEAAERWYNVVFDPMGEEVHESRPGGRRSKEKVYHPGDRNWRFTGFHETETPLLSDLLGDDREAFQDYLEDPFDPFAVANDRPLAYQRYVLMAYVDNLLDWGDSLFAQDTRESINEATLLYVTAADILGRRPVSLGKCPIHGDGATYDELNTENPFLVTAENLVQSASAANRYTCRRRIPDSSPRANRRENGAVTRRGSAGTSPPIFCVPRNEELIGYWDRVEDRLYKIRHCMNLQGVRRTLSLFEPPIEPDLLVRARAAGLTVDEVVGGAAAEAPQHRFQYLISKAKEYVSTVRSFGDKLQSALERKDTEELQRMRARHAKNLEEMKTEIRKKQIEEAEAKIDSLDEQKAVLKHRESYYGDKKRTNPQEKAATVLTDVAMGLHTAAAALAAAAPPMKATPQGHVGVSGLGPHTTVEYGGEQVGGTVQAIAKALRDASTLSNMASSRMKTQARYERRKDDWDFQAKSAEKQLNKLEKDRAAAEIRKQIAEHRLELHEEKKDQTAEVYEFYDEKLTDLDLYNWLSTELKGIYREAYQMALDVCKRAEKAFHFERDSNRTFIESGTWNGSKAGLLAGDRLQMQLQRMDKAYMETARRDFEIEQTFSLGQLDPMQLERLRQTGTAEFRLPEVAFDLAYPGQYKRRIRSVRLTVPCNAGPYVNVNAKLTQTKSSVRRAPDENLKEDHIGTESIATSQAKNDSGVFQLRFDGERYMPFEGTGAVSEWRLELPNTVRSFDYDSISDVLVHVSYTAREDGRYRKKVENALRSKLNELAGGNTLHRAYRLREQFSSAFQGFFRQGTDPRTIDITLDEKHFPHFLRGSTLELQSAVVALALNDDWAENYDPNSPLPLTVTAKSDGTTREQSKPLVKQGGEEALEKLPEKHQIPHATYFGGSGGATLEAGSTPLGITLSVVESDLNSLLSDATLKPHDIIDDLLLLLKVKVPSNP